MVTVRANAAAAAEISTSAAMRSTSDEDRV
jgi:hypothetical protein